MTRPALLHFDLWDGNVLGGPDGLTGLVDGERWLFGDPLMDIVSPALRRRIEREPDTRSSPGTGRSISTRAGSASTGCTSPCSYWPRCRGGG